MAMRLADLPTVNGLAAHLDTLKALSADAGSSDMCQFLCADRVGERSTHFVRRRKFMLAFKAFVDGQIVEAVQDLNQLGVIKDA